VIETGYQNRQSSKKDFVFKPILTNISYNQYLFESSSKKRSTIWISFRV